MAKSYIMKKKKKNHLGCNDEYQDHKPKFLEVSLSPCNVTFQQSTWKIKTEIFLGTTAKYIKKLSFNHQHLPIWSQMIRRECKYT